ncbi:MAG: radical SAM protein [Pseudomonadota bacterium]
MPRLVLLQPPIEDFYDTDIRLQPIGLCALKSAVLQHHPDMEVLVLDFHKGHGRATIPLPRELRYLKDYYGHPDAGPFRTFHQYFRFGADYDTIGRTVAELAPDLVGISFLFTPYYREGLHAAEAIRAGSGAAIIAGGSHVSADPLSILSHPAIDFVIRGEGERPLVSFLEAWKEGRDFQTVPNLGWKENDQYRLNDPEENFPLDDLPMPDMSDLPPDRYAYEGKPVAMLLSTRGCPHRCSFCSVHTTFGHYRRRSNRAILQEMRARWEEGYRVFDFEDDNLTFDREAIRDLCRAIIREFRGKEVELLAMNGVSYRRLDHETLLLMRQAGFSHLNLALVSADPAVLASVRRPHPVEDFPRVVADAFSLGYEILAHQILGLPDESVESMCDTLVLLARLPVLIGVSVFYLTPGAPIAAGFPAMTEHDFFLARSTAMAITSAACSRDSLYTLFLSARIINFLKGLRLTAEKTPLAEVLTMVPPDERTGQGFELLHRLFAEGTLYAATRQGFKRLPRFDINIFLQCWNRLDGIRTQEGKWIEVRI